METLNFLKHWRATPKIFSTVRPKFSEGKTWYPLICIKFFATPKFLKHSREAHEIFSHCETQIFRMKNVITLICIKFFATSNFLKHSREAHEIFWQCETQIFRRKTCSFRPQIFSKAETFSKTVGLPYEIFGHCET